MTLDLIGSCLKGSYCKLIYSVAQSDSLRQVFLKEFTQKVFIFKLEALCVIY